jgi:4-diphosphocytidyl-2-C-methyl-D-erythritol kinase
MATRVRSYSKINLGLAIGAPRTDGFHELVTLYQTLALHDLVSVRARVAPRTRILLQSNDSRVPTDARNTAFRMLEKALIRMGLTAEVEIHIQKNLPIQGGMGAGSANAAAALIGLERELGVECPGRMEVAAEVGSDVPLFLVGGAVLGTNRGEQVAPVGDLEERWVVMALPKVGVSTPQAFRDWDTQFTGQSDAGLQTSAFSITLGKLSRTYASILRLESKTAGSGASGIFLASGHPDKSPSGSLSIQDGSPEKQQGLPRQQHDLQDGTQIDLAENILLALVRTGIENDFETVVFLQHPPLREIKRQLMGLDSGRPAIVAALSGSGSALFGLYGSEDDARAAQQRVQSYGVEAVLTKTMPRPLYWKHMFAE